MIIRPLFALLTGCLFFCSFAGYSQGTASGWLQQGAAAADPDSARLYYEQAYNAGLAEHNPAVVSDALYALGKQYVGSGMLDSARAVADRGIALNREGKAQKAEVFINIKAATFHHKSMLDSAVHYYLDAVRILEEKQDTLKAAYIIYNIGNIFLSHKDYVQAEAYFIRVHKTILHFHDSTYLPGVLVALSATRYELGDMGHAQDYASRALELSTLRKDVMSLMLAHRQLGELSIWDKRYPDAIAHFGQALPLAEMIKMPYYIALIRMGLANAYNHTGAYKNAIAEAEISLQLAAAPQFSTQLTTVYTILSEAYLGINDYASAYKYLSLATILRDSIAGMENKKIVNDLLVKYNMEQKDRHIAEQRMQLAEAQAGSRLILAVAIAALAVLSILTILYLVRRRIHKLSMKSLREAQENEVLQAILAGEEQERIRLSSELHDGLSNPLFTCKLMLTSVLNKDTVADDAESRDKLRQGILLMETMQEDARRMAHNLMPHNLEEKGLVAALSQYLERLHGAGSTRVFFQHFGPEGTDLPQKHQLVLFRVVQELTGNALKHSGAEEIDVQLFREPDQLKITIEDNGSGFDLNAPVGGQGLEDARKRIALIGGILSVESSHGAGTHISVQLNTGSHE